MSFEDNHRCFYAKNSKKKQMSSGFVVCADPDNGWSEGTNSIVALGTQFGAWFTVVMFFYPFFRWMVAQNRTLLRVGYYFWNYPVWGGIFLLQFAFYILRPLGALWTVGCAQGLPKYSLGWFQLNVYAVPDLFMTTAFVFAVVAIYFDLQSTVQNVGTLFFAVALGALFMAYSVSELTLNRMSPLQWFFNCVTSLILTFVLVNMLDFLKQHSPYVFDDMHKAVDLPEFSHDGRFVDKFEQA